MLKKVIKINPLLKDLKEANIENYLQSNSLQRIIIKNELSGKWDKTNIKNIYINDKNSSIYFNATTEEFESIDSLPDTPLFDRLIVFFNNLYVDNIDIIADLVLDFLNQPELQIRHILEIKESLKIIQFSTDRNEAIDNIANYDFGDNYYVSKTSKKMTLSEGFDEKSLVKSKNIWVKSIAKAEIEKVVVEIIDFGVKDLNDIVALSSRWHTLKNKYHKGVIKEEEFRIENNKIVDGLLNFIKNIKDTEGVIKH